MVNLTRIYTRTGDAGQTRLGDNSVASKNDLRLHAYADVDEANAHLGLAVSVGSLEPDVAAIVVHVQNELFDVGADLCTPVVPDPEYPPLRVEQAYVDRLEGWCDQYNEPLETLRSFILSGGTPGSAHLHVCRTIVRRAERSAWAAYDEYAESMNPLAMTYLNRLSDLLFILARYSNREQGDVLWVPGGERQVSHQQQKPDHEHRGQDQQAGTRARHRSGRGRGRRPRTGAAPPARPRASPASRGRRGSAAAGGRPWRPRCRTGQPGSGNRRLE